MRHVHLGLHYQLKAGHGDPLNTRLSRVTLWPRHQAYSSSTLTRRLTNSGLSLVLLSCLTLLPRSCSMSTVQQRITSQVQSTHLTVQSHSSRSQQSRAPTPSPSQAYWPGGCSPPPLCPAAHLPSCRVIIGKWRTTKVTHSDIFQIWILNYHVKKRHNDVYSNL